MATYGFDESAAKRIGKSVRLSERYPPKVKLGGSGRQGANAGVRIMLGTVGTAAWAKRSSKTVTIYASDPLASGLPTASVSTVLCWNIMASIASVHTATATCMWVQMSCNGFGYYALGVECIP